MAAEQRKLLGEFWRIQSPAHFSAQLCIIALDGIGTNLAQNSLWAVELPPEVRNSP